MIRLNTTGKDLLMSNIDKTRTPKITDPKAAMQQRVLQETMKDKHHHSQSILSQFFFMFNQVMANK